MSAQARLIAGVSLMMAACEADVLELRASGHAPPDAGAPARVAHDAGSAAGAGEASPLAIVTEDLPAGRPCRPYHALLTAAGGTGRGYVWSIVQGSLPDGLMLAAAGTPSTTIGGNAHAGDAALRVRVTDDAGSSAERWFDLSVQGPPGPSYGLLFTETEGPNGDVRAIDLCDASPSVTPPLDLRSTADDGVDLSPRTYDLARSGDRAAYCASRGGVFSVYVVDLRERPASRR